MDGYQCFVCGHVQQILFHDPKMDNMVYLKANVLPSQRQGSKKDMYTTYLVVSGSGEQEGLIHTAHCTCMAGVGKACSHAAAVAYKVEAAIRLGLKDTACTSSLCAWNDLSRKKAAPASLADIDFKRPKYGEDVRPDNVPEMTNVHSSGANQLDISTLKTIQPSAVLFSCMDIKERPVLPPTLFKTIISLHGNNVKYFEMIPHLSETLSDTNISNLDQVTVQQSKSPTWALHRQGRITSSVMHRIYTLRDETDRTAMIKQLLETKPFSNAATKYGIKNEPVARRMYTRYQSVLHGSTFKCSESGLKLNKNFPHLGSSPDGIVECMCCGKGCLEIKCLKTYETGLPDPRSDVAKQDRQFPISDSFELKKGHKFYTQVQGHMLICDLNYCDLYLWSKTKSLTVRVERDSKYIEILEKKLTSVFICDVIPAIIKKNLQE